MTGFAGFLGGVRGAPEDRPDALARAMHAPERPDEPFDGDERAANLMARGYAAGQASDLARRYADAVTAAQDEREKLEKGERVTARVRGMLERGQIGAMEAHQRMDGDFGDVRRAEQLERQAASLRRQLEEAAAMISPPQQRAPDPVESASRSAQQLLAEVTRERTATAQPRRPERRPFVSRAGVAVRSELECVYCVKDNVSAEDSALLHHDPEYNVPVTTADQLQLEQDQAAARSAYTPGEVITTGYPEITR